MTLEEFKAEVLRVLPGIPWNFEQSTIGPALGCFDAAHGHDIVVWVPSDPKPWAVELGYCGGEGVTLEAAVENQKQEAAKERENQRIWEEMAL